MRLLVAVDLEQRAEALVDRAVKWAGATGGSLDLAYVDEYPVDGLRLHDAKLRRAVEAEWRRYQEVDRARLDALMARVPEALRGEVHVRRGLPAHELVDLADGFDALIVATHGRQGLSHMWLGSVAERVVRSSRVPCIVLRLP